MVDINQNTCIGSDGTSTVIDCTPTAGTEPFTYEWFLNTDKLASMTKTYTVQTPGTYICAVMGPCGRVTGSTRVAGEGAMYQK